MSTQAATGLSPQQAEPVTLRALLQDRAYLLYLVGQTASRGGSALASIALMPLSAATQGSARRTRALLRDGLNLVRGRPWLGAYALHETLVNVFVLSPFFVLGPLIARTRLGGAPAWSAIAFGYVAGSLAATTITYRWAPRRPGRRRRSTTR